MSNANLSRAMHRARTLRFGSDADSYHKRCLHRAMRRLGKALTFEGTADMYEARYFSRYDADDDDCYTCDTDCDCERCYTERAVKRYTAHRLAKIGIQIPSQW